MDKTDALTGKEIRNRFIQFFEKKHGHIRKKSSSLF